MYRVSKKISFCAAHCIEGHVTPDGKPGKCSRLHGHNYELGVTLQSNYLQPIGFVIDYYHVGLILKELENRWDHTNLNDDPMLYTNEYGPEGRTNQYLTDTNPTAERIAIVAYMHVMESLKEFIKTGMLKNAPKDLKVYRVWCKETDGTEAEYFPSDNQPSLFS